MHVFGHNVLFYVLWAASLSVSAFAVWKGDMAVRWAGVVQVGAYVLALLDGVVGSAALTSFELGRSLVSAGLYLLLAVRYANLWIGGAMLLQSAEFSLLAYYIVADRPADRLHAWINNTCEWGIILCILAGAVLSILRRRALAREAAELEALRLQRAQARETR
jgi:hypothetical protein